MRRILKTLKREFKRQLTVMFIPHTGIKPFRISFPISFLLMLIGCWTALTLWAGYIGSQHVEYWRLKADNQLMKLKIVFFAHQVQKSREMLDQVRENDQQLRALLEMKSKSAIVEDEGKGGPTEADARDLSLVLSGKLYDMSQQDIHRQTSVLQNEARKRMDSYNEIMGYVEHQRALNMSTPNCPPCVGGRITSAFGMRIHPIFNTHEFHSGLDIASALNTSVHSTAHGTVHLAQWQPGYGRLIIVNHGHGYQTYYGHLNKILVKPGQRVKRGEMIGLIGDSGTSTGPHVHYEVQFNNRVVNPVKYLKKNLFNVANKR